MSEPATPLLLGATMVVGVLHTVLGPDHYVPFVALARAGRWTFRRTMAVTLLCGLGHVLSSVALGAIGVATGLGLGLVTDADESRGPIATWLLVGLGLAYGTWGLWRALRSVPHEHPHAHADGTTHVHRHDHHRSHAHPHGTGAGVWVLFVVFVLGPCEPLIPLLVVPAAARDWVGVAGITAVFAVSTIATMAVLTAIGWRGAAALRLGVAERFSHAMAGGVLAMTGLAVLALGL